MNKMRYFTKHDIYIFQHKDILRISDVKFCFKKMGEYKEHGCSKRLVIMNDVDSIEFGYDQMPELQRMARSSRNGKAENIITVIVTDKPCAIGIANMYKHLVSRPDYMIHVTKTLEEAANILNIGELESLVIEMNETCRYLKSEDPRMIACSKISNSNSVR